MFIIITKENKYITVVEKTKLADLLSISRSKLYRLLKNNNKSFECDTNTIIIPDKHYPKTKKPGNTYSMNEREERKQQREQDI